MEVNQSRKSEWWSQTVCLMVRASLGQLVDECHSLSCQGHYRANKVLPWKVYNNHWQEECCLFVMTLTHRHTHCTWTRSAHTPLLRSVCLVCVCVWLCSYHHYPSRYPHVHVLISVLMSDEGSQASESLVDLFRLLLRPHSEISWSSAKDHLRGRIIGI